MFGLKKKSSLENLANFYRTIPVDLELWCLFNINKNYLKNTPLTRELDFHHQKNLYQLKVALDGLKIFHEARINKNLEYQNEIICNHELKLNFNQLIDEVVSQIINIFTSKLNTLEAIDQNLLMTEDKALEWLKVSFRVLTESITKNKLDFSYSMFIGKNPKTNLIEIRLTLFNLDIMFQLLNDNHLRVIVYNDHQNAFGSSKTPSLKGDFKLRKREMFNLLIELLNQLKTSYHI